MRRALVLDIANGQVWRGKQRLELPPKAFAVLYYLIAHADRIVSKEELLTAVWPDTVVSEWALTTCLRKIRRALGERAETPHYIATVHRRGYRWIGPFTITALPVQSPKPVLSVAEGSQVHSLQSAVRSQQPAMVGREAELEQLHGWLEKAVAGERQVVFVTGEAGIGKTTLVDAFLAEIGTRDWGLGTDPSSPQAPNLKPQDSALWISRGQCIEHYGAGEAYLPVLEALGRLCREPGHERLLPLLRQYAPTWLVQMPWLLSTAEPEGLQREVLGATRERMLREMAEMIETLTGGGATQGSTLLILVLEDLHWSDYATLDLLSSLAQRREVARLFLLATFRPVEVIVREHPLRGVKQELQQHGQSAELRLEGLTEAAVGEYLAARFTSSPSPTSAGEGRCEGLVQGLTHAIYQHTNGNPLFVVNTVDDLVARGVLVQNEEQWEVRGKLEEIEMGMPQTIRQMIETHLERLSAEEQRMLEVAGVAGVEFSTAAVAAPLEEKVEQVEERCAGLARREQFIQPAGLSEWPDGTVTARYSFTHTLYQQVLYERIAAGRRKRLHQRVGERLEAAYSERAGAVAAELAMHFEQGRDYRRAVHYHQRAAETALWRSAHQEAITHITKGLEFLKPLPDTPERTQCELTLQVTLGPSLMATKGYSAPEVEQVYARARELCRQVEETPGLFSVLSGLWAFHVTRGELLTARDLGEQCFMLAYKIQDPALLRDAHHTLGVTVFHLGEFAAAHAHLEQSLALCDSQQLYASGFGYDVGVGCLSYLAPVLWCLGDPDQALTHAQAALTRAQELSHPISLAFAQFFIALSHNFRREAQATQEQVEELMALCREQGFPHWLALGRILQGWALTEQEQREEGLAQLRQGLSLYQATGAGLSRSRALVLLAEAYGKVGRPAEGLSVVTEALEWVDKSGEWFWEAELYRLKGTLTLQSKAEEEAEECFHKAITIARRQEAKLLELRAVVSLSRLWQHQGKKKKARQMLAGIYGWFTEGFDTADLQEAKALLAELA